MAEQAEKTAGSDNAQGATESGSALTGNIHSVETLGALDGPGIRTVVFLSGCPMRCKFCHNPDTWFGNRTSERKTVAQLTDFCRRYKNYYGAEGGVTLSGGEPLFQREFCLGLIRALSSEGIGTAIDTGGAVFAPEVLDEAQLILLDVKHTDSWSFRELTGVSDTAMRQTLTYLKKHCKRFWIRQVIVPGYTDSDGQVAALKELAEGAEKIELLPYHTMGVPKWEQLGLSYPLKGIAPPDSETMRRLNRIVGNGM